MRQMTGKQSISFAKAVYIEGSAAIVGEKEKDGPLGEYFSHTLSDPMCGQESWEEGESELQLATAKLAMQKANVRPEQIRMIFAGDLLAQSIASSFGLVDLNCPLYGLFGACSTMGEALSLGAMAVAGGYGDRVLTVTSSHFGTAEKEFRFPLAYGNQRPPSASWTVTGSGACVLGKTRSRVKITGATTGKIIDYGLKDNQNMGACMAPAACDTIAQNLVDFNREPADYDRIVTGDLGVVGREILLELLKKKGYDISEQHSDCGMLIFDPAKQDTGAGGSGGVSAAEAGKRRVEEDSVCTDWCADVEGQLSGGQQRAWYCTGGCNRAGGGCVKWERSWNISMPSGSAASFVPYARFCSTARKCCREELW